MTSSQIPTNHEQVGLPSDPNTNPSSGSPQSTLESSFDASSNIIKTNKDFSVKDQVIIDDYEMRFLGGLRFNRKAFDTRVEGSVYSVTRKDYYIGITHLSYAPTVGLPSPKLAGVGKTYLIKDEAGGAATTTITVRSDGDALIDGGTTATMTGNYDSRMFYTNGEQWYIGGI